MPRGDRINAYAKSEIPGPGMQPGGHRDLDRTETYYLLRLQPFCTIPLGLRSSYCSLFPSTDHPNLVAMSRRHSNCESGEEAPFLPHEKDASLKAEAEEALMPPRRSQSTLSLCGRTFVYLLHLCFLAVNVVWSTANLRYQSVSCSAQGTIYGRPATFPLRRHSI